MSAVATTAPTREEIDLAKALGVRPLTAKLLIKRGYTTPSAAQQFLAPKLADLRSPRGAESAMAGLDAAVERLIQAIELNDTIGVFGDYDVDGITSCALVTHFLRELGSKVNARVAQREGGYGFTINDAEACASAGCQLVVVCDCGTSDHAAIARANSLGLAVIIIDHHQVSETLPPALAFINPHQPSCRFPFKGLASVGLAFYLVAALATRLRTTNRSVPDPRLLLDLVAVGTIADVSPLVEENRTLASVGLRELAQGRRPGFRALAERAGIALPWRPTSHDIGFRIAPRLNAPGRLGRAQLSLDLLLAPAAEADAMAQTLDEANRSRQQLQERVLDEAIAQVEQSFSSSPAIVVAGEGWHPGVVGIVAAKLVDRYHRPAVVIALAGDSGRGSARTPPHFNLYRSLESCSSLLERFGGHALAAGLTIARPHIAEFTKIFTQAVSATASETSSAAAWPVEAEVSLGEINESLIEEIERFAPFGLGNAEPVLGARHLILEQARVVGEKHLQVTLRDGNFALDGIGFNLAHCQVTPGEQVDAAFAVEMDTWRGRRRVRLRLQQLRSSEANS